MPSPPLISSEEVQGCLFGMGQSKANQGKKKDHTGQNVPLVTTLLVILLLSDTYGDRIHEKPMADVTPSP